MIRFGVVSALALLVACGDPDRIGRDSDRIVAQLQDARQRGAYNCAPADLARGEANVEFARYELHRGDPRRAAEHVEIAQVSADRASQLSDTEQCTASLVPNDRDADRIADDVDRCPDDAEDRDGFQDEDGCPERDNDNDGISDVYDKCPNEPGDLKHNGCPANDRDGDGIPDNVDQCPDIPEDMDGVSDHDGCPENESGDRDADGIPDKLDRCPIEPEDRDGFNDEDGCPDPDNDADTVLDIADRCPMEPGSPKNDGCPGKDRDGDSISDDLDKCPDIPGLKPSGCPRHVLVQRTDSQIKITQAISFETGKATIKTGVSMEIIDQVAAVLRSEPSLAVSIDGHTDNVGDPTKNLKLSEDRASAVRDAMVARGIDPARLTSMGFGHTHPIASNTTAKGRSQNRRVEFNIVGAR